MSLTRRPGPQSPEHCGRNMFPPGLQFGSTLRAHSHKIMPCQHSTARWPPGRGRALPQCTGYRNHNNLRGHNISAHRRHTPHILAHSTSTPQRRTLQRYDNSPALAANPRARATIPSAGRKQQKGKKRPESRFQAANSNKASRLKPSRLISRRPRVLRPLEAALLERVANIHSVKTCMDRKRGRHLMLCKAKAV